MIVVEPAGHVESCVEDLVLWLLLLLLLLVDGEQALFEEEV